MRARDVSGSTPHATDRYGPSHVMRGFIFYGILSLVLRSRSDRCSIPSTPSRSGRQAEIPERSPEPTVRKQCFTPSTSGPASTRCSRRRERFQGNLRFDDQRI
ncbi:DUF2585 family protein [Labrenzia sp. CE80]|uniref:DUF2585 family protein n=1 Tax=Labrenzia sp. CE80 TaxID=1788986 RepID=UPI00336A4B7A